MSTRPRTLASLRAEICVQADIVEASARYPDADLNRFVNQSIARFREALSVEGATHFLESVSGTLTAGATSPYAFGVLDLSDVTVHQAAKPQLVRTFGLDVVLPGSCVRTLSHVPFSSRGDYGSTLSGLPLAWAHFQRTKLAVFPGPSGAYPFTCWYLPTFADLSSDSDTFDGVAGWEEWVVWDVVCRYLIRDQYAEALATAQQYRAETWRDILKSATKVSSAGGAVVGRDSMGARGLLDPLRARRALPAP